MTFALVLERDVSLAPVDLGRQIARAARIPLADATRLLRGSRGMLSLNMDGEAAREVERVLRARGVRARLLDESALPRLPARPLRDADPRPEGLAVQTVGSGPAGVIPWSRLDAIVVGLVTFVHQPAPGPVSCETALDLDEMYGNLWGLPGATGALGYFNRRDRPRPKEETALSLELLFRSPPDRLRVLAGQFVYDYLGGRVGLTTAENFQTLVLDTTNHAPDALLPGSTQAYLEGGDRKRFRFGSAAEFESYVRWLWVWRDVWEG